MEPSEGIEQFRRRKEFNVHKHLGRLVSFFIMAAAVLGSLSLSVASADPPDNKDQPPPRVHFTKPRADVVRADVAPSVAGFAPSSTANMTYHGGPVMQTMTAYAIYWTPNGTISGGGKSAIAVIPSVGSGRYTPGPHMVLSSVRACWGHNYTIKAPREPYQNPVKML